MRRCSVLVNPLLSQLQAASPVVQFQQLALAPAAAACSSSTADHDNADRLESSRHCSTSGSVTASAWSYTQVRSYAKAAGKGGKAAKPAVAAAAPAKEADPLAQPVFRLKRVPQVNKGDPVAQLTGPQKALLEELSGGSAPLRSLRQLGWDLGPQETLALFHEQLSDVVGTNVQMVPMVTQNMFQSAADLVQVVKEFVEDGKGLPRVEQLMLTAIAGMNPSDVPFEGLKIQLKGRMSGKGGKASKKVWVWGRTGRKAVEDPVDYAHEAVVTRAGYIGIKVWVKYKRSHMPPQQHRIARPAVGVSDLLAMPPITALPSRSSSAWWNRPVTWQPQQHQAWNCFKPGYDALSGTWERQQHLEHQQQPHAIAASEADRPPAS